MATCSSILAWRIPWTEEPSGLQSMGQIQLKQLSLAWHGLWEEEPQIACPWPALLSLPLAIELYLSLTFPAPNLIP